MCEATYYGHEELVKIAFRRGANLGKMPRFPPTALDRAVQQGHANIVRILLARGAEQKVWQGVQHLLGPMNTTARRGHDRVVQVLLDYGAIPSPRFSPSPFISAAKHEQVSVVKLLLDTGLDIAKDHKVQAELALQLASEGGYVSVVRLLVRRGVDVNGAKEEGSPMLWALIREHQHVVEVLRELGALEKDPLQSVFAQKLNFCALSIPELQKFRDGEYPRRNHRGLQRVC
ncbi:hypothetical protein H2201_006812 [Coniosporium apollinis]|uniref:Ankyrin n=1 Tax=Coniosporium apollinis TaxID=61459 RepID=A0ABQ9NP70_9PEZI|nr:hypothetical protein H2201_006812 [Coniosporium apollinis]